MQILVGLGKPWTSQLAVAIAAACFASLAAESEPGGLPPARPAEVGMNAATLSRIPENHKKAVAAKQISGAVTLVARHGKLVQLDAVGLADIENNRPMQTDTIFNIASMTKPITAAAVMILQDEGKLSVEEPASKYIPQLKGKPLPDGTPAREITVRDLMTHTSGLKKPEGGGEPPRTLQEMAEAIASRPLAHAPGTKWEYNEGLTICGRIIEIVSGLSFEDFVRTRLTDPLGMKDTTFHPTAEQIPRMALVYQPGSETGTIVPAGRPSAERLAGRVPNPSGGLYSTAGDMARFYQMVLAGGELDGRRYLSRAAVKAMTTVQTGERDMGFDPGDGWGLGWWISRVPQGRSSMHSPGTCGHAGAFNTQGCLDPQRGTIYVLMIQRSGFNDQYGYTIRSDFHQAAVDAIE